MTTVAPDSVIDIEQSQTTVSEVESDASGASEVEFGGIVGPRGPRGVEGPEGPEGPQGAQGVQGPQGETGRDGPDGATGPQGPTGTAGPQGVKGDTGATGPQGPQGLKGDIGAQGPQGAKGDTGAAGATGPQGAQGDAGATGAQGPQGLKGDTGAQGATGAAGAAGPQGPQGLKGDIGLTGPQGLKGDTGAQGAAGADGAAGPQGAQGPQGLQGPQGVKGDIGLTGPQGAQGYSASSVIVSRNKADGGYWADGTSAGNTAAIQAALNALVNSQSPTLILREGVYSGLGQLVLPDIANVRIVGAGRDATILRFANLTVPCLVKASPGTQRYKYRFFGFTVDNLSKANVGSVGISYENLSNCVTEDVVFTNVETAVGLVGLAYFNRFLNCDIEEVKYGETFKTNSSGVYPNENTFFGVKHAKGTGGTGVECPVVLNGGNDNHWALCSFEDFLTGIELSDIGNTFTNCRIECNDRTGTVVYVRFNAGANNNSFTNVYFSGNKWIDRYTSIVDNGAGNSILALSTYKDQFFTAERNVLTADDMVYMKRSGSGDQKAVYTAEDTYAASGSPISYLAKQARNTGKFFRGLLNGVEKFYVGADGSGFFAAGLRVGGPVDNQWGPSVYGLKAWSFDPAAVSSQTLPASGVLNIVGLQLNVAQPIAHVYLNVGVAGSGTTNAYAALYSSAGVLLAQSDDQSANMNLTGIKTFTFAVPPTAGPGLVYVAFWVTATTTIPSLSRGASVGLPNVKLGGAYRFATTADTGLTTVAPANLGAKTSGPIAYWVGVD